MDINFHQTSTMPLFRCTACDTVENTALSNFWHALEIEEKRALCSECDPLIGQWHGEFPKQSAVAWLVDQSGNLWSQKEFDDGSMPHHFRVVGRVLPGGEVAPYGPFVPPQRPPQSALLSPGMDLTTPSQALAVKPNFVGLRPWSKKGPKKASCDKETS